MQETSAPTVVDRHEDRRWLFFVVIVTGIILGGAGEVIGTWNYFTATKASLVELLFCVPPLAFIGSIMITVKGSNAPARVVYHLTAIWLGSLSLALFASIGMWVLLGVLRIAQVSVNPSAIAWVALAAVVGASVWSLFCARRLVHTVVKIPLKPTPPASWRGRTGALVTDLHLGNILRAPFLERVVSKLEAIHPDIIFISGDLFDDTETDYDALLAPWKRLAPPLGTFYVTGNHEEFTRREKFFGPIERAGIRVLNNEKVEVDGIQIIGLHDSEATNPEVAHAILSRLRIDRKRASILVAHQPKAAGVAQDFGVSLQLSGHTHGGQCWPWTLVARRVHRAANYGLSRLGEMLIYTSSGAGTWGPPMRLGTISEVVELKFQ